MSFKISAFVLLVANIAIILYGVINPKYSWLVGLGIILSASTFAGFVMAFYASKSSNLTIPDTHKYKYRHHH